MPAQVAQKTSSVTAVFTTFSQVDTLLVSIFVRKQSIAIIV
jgi:hypothetical protein